MDIKVLGCGESRAGGSSSSAVPKCNISMQYYSVNCSVRDTRGSGTHLTVTVKEPKCDENCTEQSWC